jgi:transglutaminase superfamily protein
MTGARFRLLACCAAVLALAAALRAQDSAPVGSAVRTTAAQDTGAWKLQQELWYVMELGGAPAGWTSARIESDGQRYRTATDTRLSFGRGGEQVTIEMKGSIVETLDGRALLISAVQDLGQQSLESEYRFGEEGVTLVSRQGGAERTQQVPAPQGAWMTPMAIHRHWLASQERGATEITYRMIEPGSGLQPVAVKHRYLGQEVCTLSGRRIPVTVWETTTSMVPITGLDKYDEEGDLVYQEMDMGAGLGRVVMRLASREEAAGAEASNGPEILVATFVQPDRPIPRAASSTTATLRLRARNGELPELPSSGAQRVAVEDRGTATLTVDVNHSLPAPEADLADPSYRAPSPMVQSDDPLVRKLGDSAVRGAGDDPLDRAEALRAAVQRLISSKGLDTAFATASETARTRAGDCSEHAVLLCAMLRAQEIPARVCIGLVYADSFLGHDDIFGWHMWTQALIGGRWVDFDATLPRRYHAAHILAATTGLDEGGIDAEIAPTLLLMGNLEIEVVDVGHE